MKKNNALLCLVMALVMALCAACTSAVTDAAPDAEATTDAAVSPTPEEVEEGHMLYTEAPGKYFYGVYVNMMTGTGDSITDYSVAFNNFMDRDAYVFYSKEGLTPLGESFAGVITETAQLDALADENKAFRITSNSGFNTLPEGLLSLEGTAFDPADKESFYYIYVAYVGTEGLALEKAGRFITPVEGPAAADTYGAGKTGAIVPAGGATSMFTESGSYSEGYVDALKQGAAEAGVETPRVAVIETTMGSEQEMYDDMFLPDGEYASFADTLAARGMEPVYIPLGIDNYAEVQNTAYFADLIRSCHIVLFVGGDQALYALALANADNTPSLVARAICDVVKNGGTLGGSSAGAAAMSRTVLTNGASGSYQPMYWNGAELVDITRYTAEDIADNATELDGNNMIYGSIGFVECALGRDVLLDTHVDARGRIGRLIAALRDTDPTGLAIGMDETAGMRIDGSTGIGTVFGKSGVYVINAKNASWLEAGTVGEFGVSGLEVSYLTAGDAYDFNTDTVLPSADKKAVEAPEGEAYVTDDIFGEDQLGTAVLSFALCADESVEEEVMNSMAQPFLAGSLYTLTLTKTENTKCFVSDALFPDEDYFGAFRMTCVSSMRVDIAFGESKFDPSAAGAFEVLSVVTEDNLYAADVAFSGPISVGYEGNNKYFLDCEQPENIPDDYVEVRGADGALKAQDRVYTFRVDDGCTLRVVLEDGVFFEDGDTLLVKTGITSLYGATPQAEALYTLKDGVWIPGN